MGEVSLNLPRISTHSVHHALPQVGFEIGSTLNLEKTSDQRSYLGVVRQLLARQLFQLWGERQNPTWRGETAIDIDVLLDPESNPANPDLLFVVTASNEQISFAIKRRLVIKAQ